MANLPNRSPAPFRSKHLPQENETSLVPARVLRHLYTAILRLQLLAATRSPESADVCNAEAAARGALVSEVIAATCAGNHDQILGAGTAARLTRGESFAEALRTPSAPAPASLAVPDPEHWTLDQLAAVTALAARLQAKDHIVFALMGKHCHAESFRRVLQACGQARLPVLFYLETRFEVGAGRKANQRSEALRSIHAEFGVPVITTDVHDPVGLYRVTTEAMHNAHFERGPTVIETTHVIASGRKARLSSPQDPLAFLQSYMEARHLWDSAWAGRQHEQITAELESALASC